MKTSKISLGILTVVLTGSVAFTSCKKRDKTQPQDPDTEQATASDNSLAENTDNDLIAMGSQLSENSGTLTTYKTTESAQIMMIATCATVNATMSGTAITGYTVDFGTTGCVGTDGRTRKGKLVYDFSGSTNNAKWYRNPGFKMVVTSQNYSVDGNSVTINNKTVQNTTPITIPTGTNPGTNLTWAVSSNISITKSNNETVTWSCSRTHELLNTSDPNCYKGQTQAIDWTKAKIKLNGSSSGTNAKGENYSATATDLVRDFTCTPNSLQPHRHPFISGTIAYTPGNRPTRTIDYGNGTCDFGITITINGQTFSATLP